MGNKNGYYKYLREKKLSENSQRMFPEIYKTKIKRASIVASCALLTLILLIL